MVKSSVIPAAGAARGQKGSLRYLEDTQGTLTASSVAADSLSGQWKSAPLDRPLSFGISKSVYWVKYPLNAIAPTDSTPCYLLFQTSLIDYLDIYLKNGDRKIVYHVGDRQPFSNRPIKHRQFIVPLGRLPAAHPESVLFRIATHDGLFESLPIQLISEDELRNYFVQDSMKFGLYFGIDFYLVILTLIFFIIIRRTFLIFLVLYAVFYGLWIDVFLGFADMFFWPDTPISNTVIMISALVFSSSLVFFSVEFFFLKEVCRPLDTIIKVLTIVMVVISIPLIVLDRYTLFFIVFLSIVAVLLSLLVAAVLLAMRKKRSESYFYAVSWLPTFFGSFMYIGKVFGVVQPSPLIDFTIHYGLILQGIVLLIGVIYRMHLIQKQITADLETQVGIRTGELKLANDQLHKLASVDFLTGLYNRRCFLEKFAFSENNRHRVVHTSSIMLMDVDFFKQYNDFYGHVQGDVCLRKVAHAIRNSLPRKSDLCARYGGEEFVVYLPDTDADGARIVGERIRFIVQELNIPHEKSEIAPRVTISIGVYSYTSTLAETLDDLLKNADMAMYEAKKKGRNQIYQVINAEMN